MNSSTSNSRSSETAGPAFLLVLVGTTLGLIVGAMSLVWAVDPLQLFRAAKFYDPVISVDERTQNAGIIRNYPGDDIIIGSSLSQSCLAPDFERALGGDFLRISAAGLTAKELGFFLTQRLDNHPTKKVFHISYWFTFARQNAEEFRSEYGAFPEHFYRFDGVEKAKYLANVDNMFTSLDIMLEKVGLTQIDRVDFETRNSGDVDPNRVLGAPSVAKTYTQLVNGEKPRQEFLNAERARMHRSFEEFYVPVIAAHPDVEFHIILPPYSIIYYKAFAQAAIYRRNTMLQFRRMLIELADEYPNVVLHDYSADKDVIFDFDNYYDTHHFGRNACIGIAEGIARHPEGTPKEKILENEQLLKKWAETAQIRG